MQTLPGCTQIAVQNVIRRDSVLGTWGSTVKKMESGVNLSLGTGNTVEGRWSNGSMTLLHE